MNTGWKQKAEQIDNDLRAKEEKAKQRKINAEREAELEEERRKLALLAKNFICCVCLRPSSKPLHWCNSSSDYGVDTSTSGTKWDEPGDMQQCKICHRWACTEPEEHIHLGICKNCAEGKKPTESKKDDSGMFKWPWQ